MGQNNVSQPQELIFFADDDWREVKENRDLNNISELPSNMLYREFNNTFIICSKDIPKSDREYCYELYQNSVHDDSEDNNTYCMVTPYSSPLRLKDLLKVVSIISFKEDITARWLAMVKRCTSLKHIYIVKPKSLPEKLSFNNEFFSMQIQSFHIVIDISFIFVILPIWLSRKVDSFILEVVNDNNYLPLVLDPKIAVFIESDSEIGKFELRCNSIQPSAIRVKIFIATEVSLKDFQLHVSNSTELYFEFISPDVFRSLVQGHLPENYEIVVWDKKGIGMTFEELFKELGIPLDKIVFYKKLK